MRTRGRVDRNQTAIVEALRKAGATVEILSAVGGGVPDLLVGYRGQNILMEVKDGDAAPSEQRLTPHQQVWHRQWNGQVAIVRSVGEAFLHL